MNSISCISLLMLFVRPFLISLIDKRRDYRGGMIFQRQCLGVGERTSEGADTGVPDAAAETGLLECAFHLGDKLRVCIL